MSDELKALEAEFAMRKLELQYKAAVEKVQGPRSDSDIKEYKELGKKFSEERTAFKLAREEKEAAAKAAEEGES